MPDPNPESQRDLDDALADTFPASDPPAMTTSSIATAERGQEHPEAKRRLVDLFRVVHREDSHAAFDRERNRSGGRWSSPGVPAVYASLSPAGAILEFLAHIDGEKPVDLALISACMPDTDIEVADVLPPEWREWPYRDDVREYGNAWIRSGRSAALRLPSVLCEQACNLLLNPDHDGIGRIQVTKIEPITLDPRLLKG